MYQVLRPDRSPRVRPESLSFRQHFVSGPHSLLASTAGPLPTLKGGQNSEINNYKKS